MRRSRPVRPPSPPLPPHPCSHARARVGSAFSRFLPVLCTCMFLELRVRVAGSLLGAPSPPGGRTRKLLPQGVAPPRKTYRDGAPGRWPGRRTFVPRRLAACWGRHVTPARAAPLGGDGGNARPRARGPAAVAAVAAAGGGCGGGRGARRRGRARALHAARAARALRRALPLAQPQRGVAPVGDRGAARVGAADRRPAARRARRLLRRLGLARAAIGVQPLQVPAAARR